jgi:hypothetical protein
MAVIRDVNEITKQMQNSPTAAYLRDCSFHERMVLVSLIKCIKREGVEEIKWGEVCYIRLDSAGGALTERIPGASSALDLCQSSGGP